MRAILVRVEVPDNAKLGDACKRTLQEVEIGKSIDDTYDLVKCSSFSMVEVNKTNLAYVDCDGIKNDQGTGVIALTQTTWFPDEPMVGSFIIQGSRPNDGCTIDSSMTLEELNNTLLRSVVGRTGSLSLPPIKSCNYCGGNCIDGCSTLSHLSITSPSKGLLGYQQ